MILSCPAFYSSVVWGWPSGTWTYSSYCDFLAMGQKKPIQNSSLVEGLRELCGTYRNPFVVTLRPQPPAHLDGGL